MIQDLRFKIQERGQLLTESVVAISILIVGLMGIFGLLSRSLSLNNVVSVNISLPIWRPKELK